MNTTSICRSFLSAWCGLDHAKVGTRIARKTDMSPPCTVEAGINLEVWQLTSLTVLYGYFTFADYQLLMPEILESFRTEDFNIEYRSMNRFRFMGNGRTLRESKGEYYVQKGEMG